MISDTTPRRPHLPRNYYRRERHTNPLSTAFTLFIGWGVLLYLGWHLAQMGTASITPNLAAQTEDFNRGVDVLGAADSRTFRQPGSSGGRERFAASESRALIFTRNDSAMQGEARHD